MESKFQEVTEQSQSSTPYSTNQEISRDSASNMHSEFPLAGLRKSIIKPVAESILEDIPNVPKAENRPRKEKLYLLFLSYAEVSDETGTSALKLRQYFKLLIDSQIIDQFFKQTQAEMAFKSSTGKKVMDFDSFMVSILKISEMKYKDQPKATAAEILVAQNLLPLYSNLCKEQGESVGPLAIVHQLSFDVQAKKMLNSIAPTLLSIYKAYIGQVLITAKTNEQALLIITSDVFAFLRDFDLLRTNRVTRQAVAVMINALANTADSELTNDEKSKEVLFDPGMECGVLLTFSRYIVFLYWISIVGFDVWNQNTVYYTAAEKVYYLLAHMEFSKGINKRQPFSLLSLIPPLDVTEELVENNPWSESTPPLSPRQSLLSYESARARNECVDKLQKLFLAYCPIGATSNINKMPLYKYLAFLKDCELISNSLEENRTTLTITEAELIFTKVIKSVQDKTLDPSKDMSFSPIKRAIEADSKKDKLDFKAFCYILSQIGAKLYPSEPGLVTLFNEHIESLAGGDDPSLRSQLSTSGVLPVLGVLGKSLVRYIAPYMDHDSIMNYESFMKFCKDFGIFPELCSKPLLRSIFYSLTFAHSENHVDSSPSKSPKTEEKKAIVKAKEYIHKEAIVEALGICALRSYAFENDTEPVSKVLHLAEKMSRSKGISKVKKMTGVTRITTDDSDFLSELRMKYKEYFAKKRPVYDQNLVLNKIFSDPGSSSYSP